MHFFKTFLNIELIIFSKYFVFVLLLCIFLILFLSSFSFLPLVTTSFSPYITKALCYSSCSSSSSPSPELSSLLPPVITPSTISPTSLHFTFLFTKVGEYQIHLSHLLYPNSNTTYSITITPSSFSPTTSHIHYHDIPNPISLDSTIATTSIGNNLDNESNDEEENTPLQSRSSFVNAVIHTHQRLQPSILSFLSSEGIVVTANNLLMNTLNVVLVGSEVACKLHLNDYYGNALLNPSSVSIAVFSEGSQVLPSHLEIIRNGDNTIAVLIQVAIPGQYTVRFAYHNQFISDSISLLVLHPSDNWIQLHHNQAECSGNMDAIEDDLLAVKLVGEGLQCGYEGTHNLEWTSFVVEMIPSFRTVIQSTMLTSKKGLAVSFYSLVGTVNSDEKGYCYNDNHNHNHNISDDCATYF